MGGSLHAALQLAPSPPSPTGLPLGQETETRSHQELLAQGLTLWRQHSWSGPGPDSTADRRPWARAHNEMWGGGAGVLPPGAEGQLWGLGAASPWSHGWEQGVGAPRHQRRRVCARAGQWGCHALRLPFYMPGDAQRSNEESSPACVMWN